MKKVNLLLIFLLFSGVAAVAQEEKFGINPEVFNKALPQTVSFLKGLPQGSVVLSWIDNGRSVVELTSLKSVSIYPSQKLIDIGAFSLTIPNYSGLTETDEKVKDISTFFTTSDENTALSIAKKYNVKYILVTDDMLNKQNWMQALAKGCIAPECPSYLFNAAYNDLNPEQLREQLRGTGAEFFEIGGNYRYIIVPKDLKDTILTKMFFKSDSLANFKRIYSDERSKVFEVTEKADLTNQILAILLIIGIIAAGIYLLKKKKK